MRINTWPKLIAALLGILVGFYITDIFEFLKGLF